MGNEEYGDNGQKYLYHCPHCGAELEVYEPLDKLALSDILPGLKRRCNREGAVIVEL